MAYLLPLRIDTKTESLKLGGMCRIEQLNRMCVALITFHVCNFDGARDHAYIYIYIYIAQDVCLSV